MFLPLITSCEKLIFLFILFQIYGNLTSSLGINMELACLHVLTEELNNEGSNKHPDQRNESERLGHNTRQKKKKCPCCYRVEPLGCQVNYHTKEARILENY